MLDDVLGQELANADDLTHVGPDVVNLHELLHLILCQPVRRYTCVGLYPHDLGVPRVATRDQMQGKVTQSTDLEEGMGDGPLMRVLAVQQAANKRLLMLCQPVVSRIDAGF